MAADEIHIGDVGTVFRATIKEGTAAVNVSTATTKQLIFRKPDLTTATKTASFTTDGTDGKIEYATVAGDLDQGGIWKVQAYVVTPSWDGKSDIYSFRVHDNL